MFIERLLTGDVKATFYQAALDIGIHTVDNFNRVQAEMTKHAFPAYAFCEQKSYLGRHLIKPRSMKIHSFISRLQELNAHLEEVTPDIEGQETAPPPADEIMGIVYHSMPTTWKNKIIEQGFNYADSTIKEMSDFFETRVENLEPKDDRKNLLHLPRKIFRKSRRGKVYNSRVVESSKESTETSHPRKKYCNLHRKCSHSMDNCKD